MKLTLHEICSLFGLEGAEDLKDEQSGLKILD